MNAVSAATLPWYRHRWPWLLMSGPFLVVIASVVTLWLSIISNDGLVTEDYYKKGMAINQTLALNDHAKALGLEAGVSLKLDSISVRLAAKAKDFVLPSKIEVTITHPTRAGLDQRQLLVFDGGHYTGRFKLPAAGHWIVLLEDEAKTWRIMGNLVLPSAGETVLGMTAPPVITLTADVPKKSAASPLAKTAETVHTQTSAPVAL